MRVSIRLRAFAILMLAMGAGGALASLERHARISAAAIMRAQAELRDALDRSLNQIGDRHLRSLSRTREAVHDASKLEILRWTSQHYAAEMELLVEQTRRTIGTLRLPTPDARLDADKAALNDALERIVEQSQATSRALDNLLGAVAADDTNATAETQLALDRADHRMHQALRSCAGVIKRTATWTPQSRWALTPLELAAVLTAALFVLAWPLLRPLGRLRALSQGRPTSPHSSEEFALALRLQELQDERDRLKTANQDRQLALDRAAQQGRRATNELALLRIYNDNLINSLRSAVVVTDAEHRITTLNRPARHLLHMDDSSVGTPLTETPLFAAFAARNTAALQVLRHAINARQAHHVDAVPFHAGGAEHLLDVTVVPYMDEVGAARGLLWLVDDVTEAVRVKGQLLRSERLAAVGRLSAQVAHEIRNPLSAIALNAELLEEEIQGAMAEHPRMAEARELLRSIAAEVERLTEVTESYLQLARVPRPTLRAGDINQTVADLISMLAEEMRSHNIAVRLELAAPPPAVWMDPGQLRQALLNVVLNSRDAMPQGGLLTVRTRCDGSMVVVEIIDTGVGVAPSDLPRVFEPFYSTKANGTGLGLALTRQIIMEHSGDIVMDLADAAGTRVVIRLPHNVADSPGT